MTVLREIVLSGELGEKFGRRHRFAVKSAAEAVRALIANFPDFQNHLTKSSERNVGYHVFVNHQNIDEKELRDPASGEIRFAPVIMGAGNATGRIILGAVLVVAGIVVGTFTFGGAAALSSIMISAGAGLILGGVAEMLAPKPKVKDPPEQPQNTPSYAFDGPVNTTAQGQPVPLCYGRLIVGSAVVSAGIDVSIIKQPPPPGGYVHVR